VDVEPTPSITTTTIYVNTDDSLYSMDPATKKVALIGAFAGMGGGTDDTSVTDCAVDAGGGVWVNTQTVVYRAQLPAGGTGAVTLSRAGYSPARQGVAHRNPCSVLASRTLVGRRRPAWSWDWRRDECESPARGRSRATCLLTRSEQARGPRTHLGR